MTIYSVFDSFCTIPSWDTAHARDERRFDAALAQVVDDPSFCPHAMGDYILANHALPVWPKSHRHTQAAIDRLVSLASAQHRWTR